METYYNLPEEVVFCKRCVMSNQRPSSVPEFRHTRNRDGAKYMQINEDGVCDACLQAEAKAVDQLAGEGTRTQGTVRSVSQERREVRLFSARQWRQGQCLPSACPEVQVWDEPSDLHLASYTVYGLWAQKLQKLDRGGWFRQHHLQNA